MEDFPDSVATKQFLLVFKSMIEEGREGGRQRGEGEERERRGRAEGEGRERGDTRDRRDRMFNFCSRNNGSGECTGS